MAVTNKPLTLTVKQQLQKLLDTNVATATAKTLESIEDFLFSDQVLDFIKTGNKKTFLGKIVGAVTGRSERYELVDSVAKVTNEIREKLTAEKIVKIAEAKKQAAAKSSLGQNISGKMNKVSRKAVKHLLAHAKPRNLPSSKPYR